MFGLGERSTKRRRDESGHPIGTVVSVKRITLPSGSLMPGDDPTYDLVGYICDYGEKKWLRLRLTSYDTCRRWSICRRRRD